MRQSREYQILPNWCNASLLSRRSDEKPMSLVDCSSERIKMPKYVVAGVSGQAKTINRLVPRPDGRYVLINPNIPSQERHHEKSYTWASTLDEAVSLIRQGFHARMANVENAQAEDVIVNQHIKIWEF
jgi:hypothetical protein